jgi:serine/threonine protein phosphatase 1
MLKKINFNENDELYVIGDIFDRGPDPLGILDYIVGHKNITLLKGNHEKMFQEAFESGDYSLYYLNGGYSTHEQIIEGGFIKEQMIYHYVRRLPLYKVIDDKYILVHAGFHFPANYEQMNLQAFLDIQNEDDMLWTRENINKEQDFKDYLIISGHTPVRSIEKDRNKILKRGNTIYIDCCCMLDEFGGKLACLRLEDMKEFYV